MPNKKSVYNKFVFGFIHYGAFCIATLFMPGLARGEVSISDPDITDKVEHEFIFDRVVPFNTINVNTEKGIVRLDGKVYSLLAKERATLLAETVKGVRSVVNTIQVDPIVDRSVSWLMHNIKQALHDDPATEAYELRVKANNKGEVTLAGVVDSWQEAELAEQVTAGISGVTKINNNITVRYTSKRADSDIEEDIKGRLRWDALVDHALIHISVSGGRVELRGVVGSASEKRRATHDAWVMGVREVSNKGLNVERWARDEDLRDTKYRERSDLEVREALQDALRADPRVSDFDISLRVKNGIATLNGVVANHKARQAATTDARNTVGIMGIRNLLKVRPVAHISDAIVAKHIQTGLMRDSALHNYEIKISVKDGEVSLYGQVDSFYEKARAEDVAYRTKGVASVRNYLDVDYTGPIVYDPYLSDWSIEDFPWYKPVSAPLRNDWAIKQDIEEELFWSPFVDSDMISVSVDAGVATLTGSVATWREFEAAKENALEGGATRVINKLSCRCNAVL